MTENRNRKPEARVRSCRRNGDLREPEKPNLTVLRKIAKRLKVPFKSRHG
jgi:hypothetical protein